MCPEAVVRVTLRVAPLLALLGAAGGCGGWYLSVSRALEAMEDADGDNVYRCTQAERTHLYEREEDACDCRDDPDDLGEPNQHILYEDGDGDGFPNCDVPIGYLCEMPTEGAPLWGVIPDGECWEVEDCSDEVYWVNPDAQEPCEADGVDNDCDGAIDEAEPEMLYHDADGDGYVGQEAQALCPSSETAPQPGPDCNDGDAAISPGAEEAPGNDVDEDCDGVLLCYVDGDGDGYLEQEPQPYEAGDAIECGAGPKSGEPFDCDDGDPGRAPDQPECTRGDCPAHVDEDCDGRVDEGEDCNGPIELSLSGQDPLEVGPFNTGLYARDYPSDPALEGGAGTCGSFTNSANDGDLAFRLGGLSPGALHVEAWQVKGLQPDGQPCQISSSHTPGLWLHRGCPRGSVEGVQCLESITTYEAERFTLDHEVTLTDLDSELFLVLTSVVNDSRACFSLSLSFTPDA